MNWPAPPEWSFGSLWGGLAWGSLLLVVYAYVGYPWIARWLIAPRHDLPPAEHSREWPTLSVLVPARNEAGVIEARIRNLLEQDYPADRLEVLVISDASDDGTDERVIACGDPRVTLVRQDPRRGKTAAINAAAPRARGEILVQTDANVAFAPGSLRALASTFARPDTGLVLGEVRFINEDQPEVAGGEGLYWRFETWVKRIEAERGLLAVANGGIYALRRSLWQPLPDAIAGDAAEPLLVARQGFRVRVAPGAVALERASVTLDEEYRRKTRIIAQQVACARFVGIARLPRRIAFAYVSHKLLRYAVPLCAALAFGAALVAGAAGSVWGAIPALLVAAPLLVVPLAWLPLPRGLRRVTHTARYLLMINVAALVGTARGLAGAAPAVWETPASTRR